MKIIKKMTSFFTVVAIIFSSIGNIEYQTVHASEIHLQYDGFSKETVDNILSEFKMALNKPKNDENICNCYNKIVSLFDTMQTQYAIAHLIYCADMSKENLEEYQKMSDICTYSTDDISSALSQALKTTYRELIIELIGDIYSEYEDYIPIDESGKQFIEEGNRLKQNYIDIAYSTTLSVDEKEYKCAENYLEYVKHLNSAIISDKYNYFDYIYAVYGREYTPDNIIMMSDTVKKYMKEYYYKINSKYKETLKYAGNNSVLFENNLSIINHYASKISEELKESAEFILENNYYTFVSGENSAAQAFTIVLPDYNAAYIYQYQYGYTSDFFSTIHEFGHFNALIKNTIPCMYQQTFNIDIAEVQSQGLEALFTKFYRSLFGAASDSLKLSQASDLIVSVAAGFFANEFEYYVFKNADSITADDVLNKFRELRSEYEIYNVDLYRISHFIQQPGYYISYASSALAALDIWSVMEYDYEKAALMYTELSHYNYAAGNSFIEVLEKCGFDDIFTNEYITETLGRTVDTMVSDLIYADIDENGIVNTADIVALISYITDTSFIVTDDIKKICDLDGNGNIDVADVMRIKRYIITSL